MTELAPALEIDATRVIAGKYRLECLLGEGGMGSIWRAYNLQLELPVALKLLKPGLNSDELGERLRVEARAAAKLVHPSIVRVFDIGQAESGEPFIVMELLCGESLGDLLAQGPLPTVNAVQLLLPIAEALSLAHSRGIVHRDLKPDNVFLARDGEAVQPKLLDFGIAKVTSTVAAGVVVTQAGVLLGSPDYMSPEQAYGRSDIDERTDVWSFCVVLYECITGACPFSGTTTQAILRSVVQADPLPPDTLAEVDKGLSDIIMRGLSKDREQRPASMFDLGCELAAWLSEQGAADDVTGASLETRWLGRSSDTLLLTRPHALGVPRAQHDHATLVSVVHPKRQSQTLPLALPARRRRRWLPGVAVAAASLVGWASFTWLQDLRAQSAAADLALIPTAFTPRPASQGVSASPPAPVEASTPVPIEALAVEQPPPPPSEPAPAARTGAQAVPVVANAGKTSLRTAIASQALTLPQALPSRDPAEDLINPY